MDDKVRLLKQFYASMDVTQIKLEVRDYGFSFMNVLSRSCTIDYSELSRLVHKYRLSNVPLWIYDYLLKQHIEGNGNVCGYFHREANNVFCFNLDNSAKTDTDSITDEMQTTLWKLKMNLEALEIRPLIVQSGRGFHVWCRISAMIPNEELSHFMCSMVLRVQDFVKFSKLDNTKVNIGMYPNRNNEQQTNSLRLIGSTHVRTKAFSRIICGDDLHLLPDADFWKYLESHMYWNTVTPQQFRKSAKEQKDRYFTKSA